MCLGLTLLYLTECVSVLLSLEVQCSTFQRLHGRDYEFQQFLSPIKISHLLDSNLGGISPHYDFMKSVTIFNDIV